jgi:hypothetical protein
VLPSLWNNDHPGWDPTSLWEKGGRARVLLSVWNKESPKVQLTRAAYKSRKSEISLVPLQI